MPDYHSPTAVLRLEPHTIPHLRAVFEDCIELLAEKLNLLNNGGRMYEAWMNDPVSERMREVYNASVMESDHGGYAALRAYEAELRRIHEELGRIEAEYRRTEDTTADLFRDRA